MSITVLAQVYDEAKRLAVAGSVVARGDFRLKKLVAPLEAAGAKAPVFAKVAEAAKAVVDGPEDTSAETLLELTSLVTAVLYTQGETGAAGERTPIETTDLGGAVSQTSARLLKPLLEALTSTGSGRLEVVKEAHERGAFRDLRLVKPALAGLDDPYSEVADFLAEKVLPLYGPAILPELRAKYDPKGTKGHPRRLALMHRLDPAGTRELVTAALDGGSKEVRVAAIGCLGAKEDLPFLIEQAGAKAQDVRSAAYQALARIDDPAAVAVLAKAVAGKDLDSAATAIRRSRSDALVDLLAAEIETERDALLKTKDKKQVGEKAGRLCRLVRVLPEREHAAADAATLDLFARRNDLMKAKSDSTGSSSGSDVVEAVLERMATASKPLQTVLARAHAELAAKDAGDLVHAFEAARAALPPAEVYDAFSPYLTAGTVGKKDAAAARREAVINAMGGGYISWYYHDQNAALPPLDPRWLDVALRLKHVGLIHAVGRPGHPAVEAFLSAEFDRLSKAAKSQDELSNLLTVMVGTGHPDAADAVAASYLKAASKANGSTYWYYHLVRRLPKSAIPTLEAVTPRLKDRTADTWVEAIEALRAMP